MGDMKIVAWGQHTRARIAFWALAGVALLISHDAIWLTQIGPGEELATALRGAGHGYWGLASLALAAIGVSAAVGVGTRLWVLRRRAIRLNAHTALIQRRPYLARALSAWIRLLAVVVIGFVIQENIEHFVSHRHMFGIEALIGPEYPLALPVLTAITAVAALVAAAVVSVEHQLIAAIIHAFRRLARRAPRQLPRPAARVVWRHLSPLAADWAGRAPPRQLLTHS